MDFNNNNFFTPNMNPYFTPTSVDSDNFNPAMYNMNQLYRLDWTYPTQLIYTSNSMPIIFKIISTLHIAYRDSPPRVNLSITLSTVFFATFYFKYSFFRTAN